LRINFESTIQSSGSDLLSEYLKIEVVWWKYCNTQGYNIAASAKFIITQRLNKFLIFFFNIKS